MYTIVFSEDAKKDLKELNKRSPQAVSKLSKLLDEVREHPRTGTGQVEQLKGYDGSVYSRRITIDFAGHLIDVNFTAREIICLCCDRNPGARLGQFVSVLLCQFARNVL